MPVRNAPCEIDSRADIAHILAIRQTCFIAGADARVDEFIERGVDAKQALRELYEAVFGPGPASPPFPDLISDPTELGDD